MVLYYLLLLGVIFHCQPETRKTLTRKNGIVDHDTRGIFRYSLLFDIICYCSVLSVRFVIISYYSLLLAIILYYLLNSSIIHYQSVSLVITNQKEDYYLE